MSILGMAAIRINGREIKTEGKSTLNPGGKTRTQHMGGGKVWGLRQDGGSLDPDDHRCREDMDVIEISNWEA
jgi:hypothetical protein